MSKIRTVAIQLGVFLSLLWLVSPAMAHSGHTVWGAWRFDWEVKDGSGIAIRNVYYNNEFVLYKASLPVKRVRYEDNACGPYEDRINWGNLVNISGRCGGKKVCQFSYTGGDGRNWLELAILAKIGKYRIYQAWYLSEDGQIEVRLFSKGLHCEVDHGHHPYWRFDFDIDGSSSDQIFVHDDGGLNEGWGPGWHKYTNEQNDLKRPDRNRAWFVRDNPTGHGVWIFPGSDGNADFFSTKDVGPRLYHDSEDEPWPFGASGHLGYNNGEGIQEKDIVFWYVAHLQHEAAGGGDAWHFVGPTLFVHR